MSFAAYGAPPPASTGCSISTEGLSPEVVKQMMDLCVKDKEKQASITGVASENIKNLGEFATISKEFASSLGIAANELGVAANTFLASPAGMLTAGVIIWKVFAMNILGLLFILVTIGIWIFMLRAVMTEKFETKMVEGWGKTQKEERTRVYIDFGDLSGERVGSLFVVNAVPIILIIIIVANMMH
jgi:hypothetical protein